MSRLWSSLPGLEPFDPKVRAEYRYGEFQNVVTSMDYERLLSSTGPYQGEILRASDKKHPHNVAWIQCVGSQTGSRGRQQLLLGRMLHLYPETGDPHKRPSTLRPTARFSTTMFVPTARISSDTTKGPRTFPVFGSSGATRR